MNGVARRRAPAFVFALLGWVGMGAWNARAGDATWLQTPGSNDWNTNANWNPSTVPTGTATFGTSNTTSLTFSAVSESVGALQFNAGASAYTFALTANQLTVNGAGIVNNSSNAPTFSLDGSNPVTQSMLNFRNAATAGNANINATNAAFIQFFNTSSAASATFTLTTAGTLLFNDSSTAGSATINDVSGELNFFNSSSAGTAKITSTGGDLISFGNSSTAANAQITIGSGAVGVGFFDSSSAGNAVITNSSAGTPLGGGVFFVGGSTAANATIANNAGGTLSFGSFTLTFNPLPNIDFSKGTGSAGNATIINNGGGSTTFYNQSTAGTATIINNSGGSLLFVNAGGLPTDPDASTARVVNNAGGKVDISGVNAGVSVGSIEGAGQVFLGSKALTLGNTNLNTTISGVIADGGASGGTGGSLVKVGTGTLTLSAANTYTAGTTVTGGLINFNSASNFGTGAITLNGGGLQWATGTTTDVSARLAPLGSGGGTFDTNGNNVTLASALSGVGGVTKIGAGTLTLSAVDTYSGATTVNTGTLVVNGSIASSAVTVNSGATLAGTGTVGATTVNSGGIFAPGNSPGTMTVQGNLAFQSGALYVVQVNPATASSANVTAGGNATLAGTVQAAFAPGSYLTRSYTIVSAAGGLGGTTFNALTTSNLPAGFTANLSYTANAALLNLTATLAQPSGPTGPSALGAAGFNVNQLNVANALNGFFNNGGALPPAFVSIFGLTGANLGNALTLLSGEAATGSQQAGFQLGNQFLGLMLDPFVDGRSGVGGTDHPALGFAPEGESMPPQIALAYASVFKAPPKPAPVVYEPRWTVWGAGFGGSNRTSGDIAVTGSHDLSATTAGFAGGFDYHLSRDSVVGLALAGGGTGWSVSQGLGGGKSDAFQAGLYGATKYGPAYLAAAFAFANHWMSTDRLAFAGDHLTASFNAQSYGGRLEGGYRFATVYAGITPYAAIQAQNFHTPGYSESGVIANGFALAFNGRDATDTRSELGARFDRALAVYTNAVLALRGRVAWAHDWVSDPSLTPLFQTLPGASFVVNGATPAKDSVLTTAGAEYRLASGVTVLAKFDGEFASHSSTYAGTGTVRYAW
jgi:autotransporter-associated beta strand protein